MFLRKRSGDVPGLFFLRRVLLRRGHWGGRGRNRGPEKVFSRSAFGGAGKGEGASGEFLSEGAGRACAARAEAFRRSSAGRPQRRSGALPEGPKKGALETAMPDASPAGRARSIHVGPCLLPGISRGAGAVFCRSGVRRQEPGRGKADAAARRQQGAEGRSALDQFSAAWRFSQRRISFIFLRRTR